jgi:HAMP domain-containing protein
MRVPLLQSLGVRLAAALLVLIGLTLTVATELNRRAVERILNEQVELQATLSTAAVVDGLDAVLGSVERLAALVGRDLEGRPVDAAEVRRVVGNALADQPQIVSVGVGFEPGVVGGAGARFGVAARRANTAERQVLQDLAQGENVYWEREWYREAIDRAQPVWGEPFFDRGGTERNAVRLAVPFFRPSNEDRVPAGVVVCVLELDWLRRLANLNEFSDTSFIVVFSRNGRLIIHPKANYAIAETIETLADKTAAPEYAQIRQQILARRQGSLSFAEGTPARRVHVNYKVSRVAGWGVIVGYDEAEFLKSQRSFRRTMLLFLGGVLVAVGGIVIGVTRRALRPLGPLAGAAGEIARGNLDCTVPEPARNDEVGVLARAFREMRDGLKAQYLERRWASQSLEHQLKYNQLIIDSIGELVFVVTKTLAVSRINPAVTRAIGFDASDLIRAPLARVLEVRADAATGDIAQALKDSRPVHDVAVTLTAKDGTKLPARLALVPVIDANRVVGGVATVIVEKQRPS